jgi:hypothetical protein
MIDEEDGSNYQKLICGFRSHANIEKRQKAERLAAMKPNDGRRKRVKEPRAQFNVRIKEESVALAKLLIEKLSARDKRDWSQSDLVEAALAALAEEIGGKI